nr:unnamed protein product [Callosobruchus analis]
MDRSKDNNDAIKSHGRKIDVLLNKIDRIESKLFNTNKEDEANATYATAASTSSINKPTKSASPPISTTSSVKNQLQNANLSATNPSSHTFTSSQVASAVKHAQHSYEHRKTAKEDIARPQPKNSHDQQQGNGPDGFLPVQNRRKRVKITGTANPVDDKFTAVEIFETTQDTSLVHEKLVYVYRRFFSDNNLSNLKVFLSTTDMSEVFTSNDVDAAWSTFWQNFIYCMDRACPFTKTKVSYKSNNSWVDEDIISESNTIKNLYWLTKTLNHPNILETYKEAKKVYLNKLQLRKREYYQKRISEASSTPQEIWNIINLNTGRTKYRNSSFGIRVDGVLYDDPKAICDMFCEYFSLIAEITEETIEKFRERRWCGNQCNVKISDATVNCYRTKTKALSSIHLTIPEVIVEMDQIVTTRRGL